MYSFYGGQKGQDFRISQIFSNRSEDLLKDLQARWYSPINVGDYVFISYGDIAELNKIYKNENGETIVEPSTYEQNLNIDLMNCGKSYTNSIWQKIYVEDSKEVSPDFPNSEENVYVFINFEDVGDVNPNGDGTYSIYSPSLNQNVPCDKDGNWINPDGTIIRFRQIPGESLKETSDIYSEENFGFGYRLIACVTGQTPRIQVFHQTIDIEDGDPYVTYDLTNPDKPQIKFYQQRAQRIENIYNTVLGPTRDPDVDLLVSGEVREIDGKLIEATLTKPILDFQLPREVKYFSGPLFGQGDLNEFPFSYTAEHPWSFDDIIYSCSSEDINKIVDLTSLLRGALSAADISNSESQEITIPAGRMRGDVNGDGKIDSEDGVIITESLVGIEDEVELMYADLNQDGTINTRDGMIAVQIGEGIEPAGKYSIDTLGNWEVNPNYATESYQFYVDIPVEGITTSHSAILTMSNPYEEDFFRVEILDNFIRIYAKLCPINEVKGTVLYFNGGNGSVEIMTIDDTDKIFSVRLFTEYINNNIDNYPSIKNYYYKDKSLLNILSNTSEVDDLESKIPWGLYGFNKNTLKYQYKDILEDYCNAIRLGLYEMQEPLEEFISNYRPNVINDLNILNSCWGKNSFYSKEYFNTLNANKQYEYCYQYYKGYMWNSNLSTLLNLYNSYDSIIDLRWIYIELHNKDNLLEESVEREYLIYSYDIVKYIQKYTYLLSNLRYHFALLEQDVLPGDMYINKPSGRLYQFKSKKENLLSVRYIGIITAPPPELDLKEKNAFEFFVQESKYIRATPSLSTNLLIGENDNGYREKFTFHIPNIPHFKSEKIEISNREQIQIFDSIEDEDTQLFRFFLPKAIHIFTASDLKNLSWDTDTNSYQPNILEDRSLSENDIYIHTVTQVDDPCRGWVFMYIDGKWIKQGSILGPVGTPQSVKTLQFIRKDDVKVGSLEQDGNDPSIYYISKIDELNDIISQYDIANGVPNSQNGEVYTMNIYHIDKEDATKLVAEETWWGQYINDNWSLMLLTGEATLSDSLIEDDKYAKSITYTASYLNKKIPIWDTESYY